MNVMNATWPRVLPHARRSLPHDRLACAPAPPFASPLVYGPVSSPGYPGFEGSGGLSAGAAAAGRAGNLPLGRVPRGGCTWEEAAAIAEEPVLYRIFDVPHISQVYMFYRCGVQEGKFGVGPESLETELLLPEDIPWDKLAFPVVRELLREYLEDCEEGHFPVRHSVISYGRR